MTEPTTPQQPAETPEQAAPAITAAELYGRLRPIVSAIDPSWTSNGRHIELRYHPTAGELAAARDALQRLGEMPDRHPNDPATTDDVVAEGWQRHAAELERDDTRALYEAVLDNIADAAGLGTDQRWFASTIATTVRETRRQLDQARADLAEIIKAAGFKPTADPRWIPSYIRGINSSRSRLRRERDEAQARAVATDQACEHSLTVTAGWRTEAEDRAARLAERVRNVLGSEELPRVAEASTRIEWGVRLLYADGSSTDDTCDTEDRARRIASTARREVSDGTAGGLWVDACPIRRTVTVGPWEPTPVGKNLVIGKPPKEFASPDRADRLANALREILDAFERTPEGWAALCVDQKAVDCWRAALDEQPVNDQPTEGRPSAADVQLTGPADTPLGRATVALAAHLATVLDGEELASIALDAAGPQYDADDYPEDYPDDGGMPRNPAAPADDTRVEWGVRMHHHDGSTTDDLHADETTARLMASVSHDEWGSAELIRRAVGSWEVVPDGPETAPSATETAEQPPAGTTGPTNTAQAI